MRKYSAVLVLGLAAFAGPSSACQRDLPKNVALDSYRAVFIGRVTGVHLRGYESAIAGRPDAEMHGIPIFFGEGSSIRIHTVPLQIARGQPSKIVELRLAGCADPLPNLKERGIFFVDASGQSAVTVWESDRAGFNFWRKRLGLRENGL